MLMNASSTAVNCYVQIGFASETIDYAPKQLENLSGLILELPLQDREDFME